MHFVANFERKKNMDKNRKSKKHKFSKEKFSESKNDYSCICRKKEEKK